MKYATRDGSPSSSMMTNGWLSTSVFRVARGRNVSPGVTVVLVLMYSLLGSVVLWPGPGEEMGPGRCCYAACGGWGGARIAAMGAAWSWVRGPSWSASAAGRGESTM